MIRGSVPMTSAGFVSSARESVPPMTVTRLLPRAVSSMGTAAHQGSRSQSDTAGACEASL